MTKQILYQTLVECKRNKTDFVIYYNYLDEDEQIKIDDINCGWHWDCEYPNKINVYDKDWDQEVSMTLDEMVELKINKLSML